eukprot:g10049.t1
MKNMMADISAAVQASLTLPKAMPTLPPGIAIVSRWPRQRLRRAARHCLGPLGGGLLLGGGDVFDDQDVEDFDLGAQGPEGASWQGALLDDGGGNMLQLQSAFPGNQVEIVPHGLSGDSGFFPVVPVPSAGTSVLVVPKVVMPAQLPSPKLKDKPLEEPPQPIALPKNASQPLHQHKMHEKELTWQEVLDGIKELADNGHERMVAKLATMANPDGDSDEESELVAQPQIFNDPEAVDEDLFGFDAVDAKQNAKTVATYKTAYLARCVSLMKKLGKSSKRSNCSPAALEMLFKSFHLCGDFKKSKPAYYSHVKCYIERVRWLTYEEQLAHSRFFKILPKNKTATQQPGQEEGFRVSRMILMCYGIRDSVDTVIHVSDKKDAYGRRLRLTAGQVMRFGIAAWFGFLRPDEALSSTTTRTFSWRNGIPVVEYYLPFRKNRPSSPYSALYRCCCSYSPYLDIPLCPVHCIDEANSKYAQKAMNQEAWRKCLRIILHSAGFPPYSVNGRMLLNLYSHRAAISAAVQGAVQAAGQQAAQVAAPAAANAAVAAAMAGSQPMLEVLRGQQQCMQMQGAGTAADAQRDHVNDINAGIMGNEHCDDAQYLQMSRALDARDILRCCSDKHIPASDWTPGKLLSAMACVGVVTVDQANNMIQTVLSAILGSMGSKGVVRPAIAYEQVSRIFWRALRIILSSARLVPSALRRNPVAQNAAPGAVGAPAETEVERYGRRLSLTLLANFHMKFDHEIEMYGRELLLKAEVVCETASIRADNERLRAEMRTIKKNPGNKNTPPGPGNKITPPGGKGNDDRGGVLGKYMKPGEKRTSPHRQNPKDRLVCWKWVKGCCGELTADGKCPEGLGRHGGSARRILHVNAEKKLGLTEDECRAKATEPRQDPPHPGKMSERTDYHKEILKDFHRQYGAGSVLPECVRDCIRFVKEASIGELMVKSRAMARMMLRVHEDLYELEKLEHMQFPPHLCQLYKDKCFLFMERLAVWAIAESPDLQPRKAETLSIFAKMKKGLSTRGEISPSGFWRLLPEEEQQANRMEAEAEIRNQTSRKPYDHWASEAQIDEMLRQTEKNIKKGIWKVLDIAHDGAEAKKVFPVEQGNKTRLCCDFRMRSLMMYALEKMRMLGVRATQEAMARCMSPFAEQCSLSAFRSDMKADVDTEKANREATRESATKEAVSRYKADFEFLAQSAEKLERRIDENLVGDEPYGFTPFSRSVYECVHASEVRMLIISRLLKVIATIYIDDLHSQSKELLVHQDAELISLCLSLAGWPESEDKREERDRIRKRSLIVLGVAYELGPDARWISMSIDPSRVDKLMDMGKQLKLQLSQRSVELDLLNSFKGLFRHVAQLVPTFNHLVRGLDCWTVEEYFQAHIRNEKERRALGALIGLLLSCVPFAQKVQLSPTFFDMPIAHIYSDAAAENVQELGRLLKTGVRQGLERFKMKIGALIVRPDGTAINLCANFLDTVKIG